MGWVKRVEPERDLSNHTCPTPSLEDCKYGEVWRCTGEELFPITRADARGERVRVPSLADVMGCDKLWVVRNHPAGGLDPTGLRWRAAPAWMVLRYIGK